MNSIWIHKRWHLIVSGRPSRTSFSTQQCSLRASQALYPYLHDELRKVSIHSRGKITDHFLQRMVHMDTQILTTSNSSLTFQSGLVLRCKWHSSEPTSKMWFSLPVESLKRLTLLDHIFMLQIFSARFSQQFEHFLCLGDPQPTHGSFMKKKI